MQFLWRYIDDLVGKGLQFNVLMELMVYTAATLVPLALPLSLLLSSIMTFGNLGEHYELTALKSAGISLQRIMTPLITITLFISIGAFLFSNHVLPIANLKMRSLLYDVQRQRPELQITEGVFYNGIQGYSIRIGKKNMKTNLLRDIKIYDHTSKKGNIAVTVADSGYMKVTEDEKFMVINLFNGHNYYELVEDRKKSNRDKTYPHRRDEFKEQNFLIELTGFGLNRTDENLFRSSYQMLNLNQLELYQDSISNEVGKSRKKYRDDLMSRAMFKSDELMKADKRRKNKKDYNKKQEELLKKREEAVNHDEGTTKMDLPDTLMTYPERFIDSVFHHLPQQRKTMVMSQAMNFARNAKNIITNSQTIIIAKQKRLRRYQIEWHRKFTLSFACLIFFFIGAPLGAIIRKGGLGLPVIISTLFFIFYYIITITTEKMARELIVSPMIGMWMSSLILAPLGIFLTYKATADAGIMNLDTYLNLFKKLFRTDRVSLGEYMQQFAQNPESTAYSAESVEEVSGQLLSVVEEFRKGLSEDSKIKNFVSIYYSFQSRKSLEKITHLQEKLFRRVVHSDLAINKNVRHSVERIAYINYKEYEEPRSKPFIHIIMTILLPIGIVYFTGRYIKLLHLKRKMDKLKNDLTLFNKTLKEEII
jgi:lipopolysaccharide export system permease protein